MQFRTPSDRPLGNCGVMQDGWTPLHRASGGGHTAVVAALLAAGADVKAKTNVSVFVAIVVFGVWLFFGLRSRCGVYMYTPLPLIPDV